MKPLIKIFILPFLLLPPYLGSAQNLVPNPSFEDTISCPSNGFIINSEGWKPYSSSPDYYHNCVPPSYGYSVPINYTGTQIAASGQAYAGAICYIEQETNYALNREIIGCSLTTPLTVGQKYFVSFKTVAIPYTINVGSSMYINKLGALFSTVPYTNVDSTTIPPIENFAHVYTNSIITDTVSWSSIFGSFTADSAYSYISIGNFFENINTDTTHHTFSSYPGAYYLFDDICVSTDSSFCEDYQYTGMKSQLLGNSFTIYPNPATDLFFIKQENITPYDLVVSNIQGEKLYEESNITDINKTINTSKFPKGILILNIKASSQLINFKLLKQ